MSRHEAKIVNVVCGDVHLKRIAARCVPDRDLGIEDQIFALRNSPRQLASQRALA